MAARKQSKAEVFEVTTRIQAIAAGYAGVSVKEVTIALRPPLTSQSNRLYDVYVAGRHLIAKQFLKTAEFAEAPWREYKALRRLAQLEVAPRAIGFAPATPSSRPLVIYEFMAGTMWDRRVPTPEELLKLAMLWLAVNELRGNDLWLARGAGQTPASVIETARAALSSYQDWARGESFGPGVEAARFCLALLARRQSSLAALESWHPVRCFCRSDPRFANVIGRSDGRLGMVDWEDSGLRDPALEIADAVLHVNQEDLLSWAAWQHLIEPYAEARAPYDPTLLRRVHFYLGVFPLFWVGLLLRAGVAHARRGTLATWSLHTMTPNARLRRYVARALAWPKMDFAEQLGDIDALTFFPTAV